MRTYETMEWRLSPLTNDSRGNPRMPHLPAIVCCNIVIFISLIRTVNSLEIALVVTFINSFKFINS